MKKLYLFLFLVLSTFIYSQNNFTAQSDYYFYENKGQIIDQEGKLNPKVKYLFNSGGLNVQIREEGFSYDVYEVEKTKKKRNSKEKDILNTIDRKPKEEFDYKFKFHRVDIDFLNANKNPEIIAEGKSTDYENYYNIPGKPEGVTEVHCYQKVTYKNIYPNVDLVFFKPKDTAKTIEYNFIIHPKGKISDIKLKFKGAKTKLKDGKLSMNLRFGEMQENIPHSWIEEKSAKTNISVQFKEIENGVFGLSAPQDSFDKTVVIDPMPTRIWGTYYGGELANYTTIKTDDLQNVYLQGITNSTTNIATNGSYQTFFGGGYTDLFIAKLNKNGQRIWGTYYGNDFMDEWGNLDFDENYNIYASGTEYSSQTIYRNYFLLKLNANGEKIYRTQFHFTNGYKDISDLKVFKDNLYIIGTTNSTQNIATPGAYQEQNIVNNDGGNLSGVITKLKNDDGSIIWCSYFGGENNSNSLEKIVNIEDNSVEIVGLTRSTNMPLVNPFQNINNGGTDAIYIKISSDGKTLLKSSYLGNDFNEYVTYARINGNTLQLSGDNLIANNSSNYSLYIPFIYKVDLANNNIIEKKLFSNLRGSYSYIDKIGNTYFSAEGYFSDKLQSTTNAYLENKIGYPYFFKIDTSNNLVWSTYYGGIDSYETTITKDDFGYVYFSGTVELSKDGFATPGTHQEKQIEKSASAYIAKFADCESNVKVSYTPICNGKDLELKVEGGDTYEWFGPNNFHSFDQNPIIKNAQISDSGEYFVRATGPNTCGGIFTLNVVIGSPAPPKPDIIDLTDITGDCNTILTAPTATDGCGNRITATTTDQTSGFVPGNHTITWKYDDGNGNIFTQTQKVIITSPDLPKATSPQTFCATLSPKISNISITGQNIIWYDDSGNVLNTTTPLIDGTTYYASQTINGCESDKIAIQVKVNATPLPIGNVNQDFCTSRNAQIKDLAVTGTSLKVYDSLGNVLPNTTVLQNNTSYFATQTLNSCESPKLEIKVTLTANSLPAQDYNLAFCNDTTSNSKIEDLTQYQENLITNSSTYIFEYFDQSNQKISDFKNRNLTIGQNIFNVKISTTDGCWKTVKLILQLNPKPVVSLPAEAEYCRGLFVELDAGGGYSSYSWNTGEKTQKISVNKEGTYIVKVTNASNCENSSSTLVKQSILANILKVEIYNNNAKVLLSAEGDFEYSLNNINWQNSNEFKNLGNGNHTVFVRTKLGCIIGQMNFTIFNISNSFTPNGDGINDTWKIDGMENYPNSEITVLDRQSTIVLRITTNGNFEWNGHFNGRVLPSGTYWYIIKVSDGRMFQGSLLIKNRN